MPSKPAKQDVLIVTFEDNRLLSALFGHHDEQLRLIEDRLAIKATPRGNRVALRGMRQDCEMAREILGTLYDRLERGLGVDYSEIEGQIKLAHARANGKTEPDVHIRTKRRLVTARTHTQALYIQALKTSQLIFGIGPAGTGKTYLAVASAAAALANGEIDRIILSRPAVEAGETLGFLPGDMKEKVDPYLRPLYDALYDTMPGNLVARGLAEGTIEIAPLAFMRGRTLSSAFVILDEAQNTTSRQMKMFLTRFGEGSRMVVNGDPSQIDLPAGEVCGLRQATRLLDGVKGTSHIVFGKADIIRHPLVASIVEAYDQAEFGLQKLNSDTEVDHAESVAPSVRTNTANGES
ncbi:MAG: PhoH family protein [Hyphomicrobiales bacterium]